MQPQGREVVGGHARDERTVGHHALIQTASDALSARGASRPDEDDPPGVAGMAPRPRRWFGLEFNPYFGARTRDRGVAALLRGGDPRADTVERDRRMAKRRLSPVRCGCRHNQTTHAVVFHLEAAVDRSAQAVLNQSCVQRGRMDSKQRDAELVHQSAGRGRL